MKMKKKIIKALEKALEEVKEENEVLGKIHSDHMKANPRYKPAKKAFKEWIKAYEAERSGLEKAIKIVEEI